MTEKSQTRITQVRTIGIPVADQDRAVTFYTETLGFEVRIDDTFGPGQRWIEVAPPGAGASIALTLGNEATRPGVDTGIRFATHDASADHAQLLARGVDVDPELILWEGVPPMFSLRDPDGNVLYVVEQV